MPLLLEVQMYKSDFDKALKQNSVSNMFLFYGENSFLIDYYINMLIDKPDAIILKFYFDEYNFGSAKAHLSQPSLFGDTSILIIKAQKKVPKKELDTLYALCEQNNQNIFIYAYFGEDHSYYKDAYKKQNIMNVRFFNPSNVEALNILRDRSNQLNLKIDNFTLNHLLNLQNQDVALAYNELEKLTILNKEITQKDCDRLVFGLSEMNLNNLIDSLMTKKDFKLELENLLDHSYNEVEILGAINKYIAQLYMCNIYIRANATLNIAEVLGYNPPKHIASLMQTRATKIKLQTFAKLLKLLIKADLELKNSHNDKYAILISTLLEFQRIL